MNQNTIDPVARSLGHGVSPVCTVLNRSDVILTALAAVS